MVFDRQRVLGSPGNRQNRREVGLGPSPPGGRNLWRRIMPAFDFFLNLLVLAAYRPISGLGKIAILVITVAFVAVVASSCSAARKPCARLVYVAPVPPAIPTPSCRCHSSRSRHSVPSLFLGLRSGVFFSRCPRAINGT